MSEIDDDLEVQALQRELDDAFATTRPRRGFEDELWARMQSSRPARNRLGDAWAGFVQAIRDVPAVPAAAVATVLVLALGVGLVAYSGLGRRGGPSATSQEASTNFQAGGAGADQSVGGFGRLPSPVLGGDGKSTTTGSAVPAALTPAAFRYVWAGSPTFSLTTAPVYRYHEPGQATADELASSLGAVLRGRPDGLLGSYSASTYTLNVRGTLATPASSPTYFIIAAPSMPPVDAASANPADAATIFLAAHSLVPQWESKTIVDAQGNLVRVRLARQFQVAGYGAATLVDPTGEPYGIEVDLNGTRPTLVAGMLSLSLDSADYRVVAPADVLQSVLNSGQAAPASAPAVRLTKVDLVYVLVPAGDHSYYEPAYLFTGSLQAGGATTTQRLLVAAVDASQRSR